MPRHRHKLTRREFGLFAGAAVAAAGLGAIVRKTRQPVPVTGLGDRRLAVFDRLMASVIRQAPVPGAALAIARHDRLLYVRGFGFADPATLTPTQPDTRFRIGDLSMLITAVAVLRLADQGKLDLDDPVLKYVRPATNYPAAPPEASRLHSVTIRHCLQHTGGWDESVSPDPCGRPWEIAAAMGKTPPISVDDVVRFGLARQPDHDPGTRQSIAHFGYLLLGRVIASATGRKYEEFVRTEVLAPLGIEKMQLGRSLPEARPSGETRYHDTRNRRGPCLLPPRVGEPVPLPDGADNFETFEAHGGWTGSVVDLVRLALALTTPGKCPVLSNERAEHLFERPACARRGGHYLTGGWNVRPAGRAGRSDIWQMGSVSGAAAMLVKRGDGVCWAALFNTDSLPTGTPLPEILEGHFHQAADSITSWPDNDLFQLPSKKLAD